MEEVKVFSLLILFGVVLFIMASIIMSTVHSSNRMIEGVVPKFNNTTSIEVPLE